MNNLDKLSNEGILSLAIQCQKTMNSAPNVEVELANKYAYEKCLKEYNSRKGTPEIKSIR